MGFIVRAELTAAGVKIAGWYAWVSRRRDKAANLEKDRMVEGSLRHCISAIGFFETTGPGECETGRQFATIGSHLRERSPLNPLRHTLALGPAGHYPSVSFWVLRAAIPTLNLVMTA